MNIAKNSKAPARRWLVDASIYIFRAYFSLPPHWQSEDGYDTEAVYGFTNFLLDLMLQSPTHLGVCFDESLETGFRHRLYPQYKASRALPDAALAYQLSACQSVAAILGLACFTSEEYEADDLIGSLLAQLQTDAAPVAILTRDKDLGQLLIREQDYLWDYAGDSQHYRAHIYAKFGVWPEQLVDYLALVGDSSDDIPGVAGIGKKTAAALLASGHPLERLLEEPALSAALPLRGAGGLHGKLQAHAPQIDLARQLARIVCDQPLISHVDALALAPIKRDEVVEMFRAFGIGRLSAKLDRLLAKRQNPANS